MKTKRNRCRDNRIGECVRVYLYVTDTLQNTTDSANIHTCSEWQKFRPREPNNGWTKKCRSAKYCNYTIIDLLIFTIPYQPSAPPDSPNPSPLLFVTAVFFPTQWPFAHHLQITYENKLFIFPSSVLIGLIFIHSYWILVIRNCIWRVRCACLCHVRRCCSLFFAAVVSPLPHLAAAIHSYHS